MIITNKTQEYNLQPSTVEEEIAQNIRVILNTIKGTVPLNRNLGLDISFIDEPANTALMRCKFTILEAINKDEPRVEVIDINVQNNKENALNGDFTIEVEVEILNEFR